MKKGKRKKKDFLVISIGNSGTTTATHTIDFYKEDYLIFWGVAKFNKRLKIMHSKERAEEWIKKHIPIEERFWYFPVPWFMQKIAPKNPKKLKKKK